MAAKPKRAIRLKRTYTRLLSQLKSMARSGSTKTGPFHDLRQRPVHEEGPQHYEEKAEIEHTSLLQVG